MHDICADTAMLARCGRHDRSICPSTQFGEQIAEDRITLDIVGTTNRMAGWIEAPRQETFLPCFCILRANIARASLADYRAGHNAQRTQSGLSR